MFRKCSTAAIFPLVLVICNELVEIPALVWSLKRAAVIVNCVRLILMHLIIEIYSLCVLVRILILSQVIWNDSNLS